jgi:hypothetical protein
MIRCYVNFLVNYFTLILLHTYTQQGMDIIIWCWNISFRDSQGCYCQLGSLGLGGAGEVQTFRDSQGCYCQLGSLGLGGAGEVQT